MAQFKLGQKVICLLPLTIVHTFIKIRSSGGTPEGEGLYFACQWCERGISFLENKHTYLVFLHIFNTELSLHFFPHSVPSVSSYFQFKMRVDFQMFSHLHHTWNIQTLILALCFHAHKRYLTF